MTEKVCPFMSSPNQGNPYLREIQCIKELCMAWEPEKREVHDPIEQRIIDIPGYCRLIP